MAKQGIICISDLAKREILDRANRTKLTAEENEQVSMMLELPQCPDDKFLMVGEVTGGVSRGRKSGGKRAPSAYNLFIGECMKRGKIKSFGEAPQKMRECAVEWKQKKKNA